jgi:hypothetical protein
MDVKMLRPHQKERISIFNVAATDRMRFMLLEPAVSAKVKV